ncbi:tetratricopeptide repeat protein [Candidatus Poribacteria bacterium]|nr:tetratricopeptide repeat protein [Candidatus Poribacteria bacterium]
MLTRCSLGFLLISSCLTLLGCAISSDEATIDQYNQFAIRSAKLELWNESIFRWEQILEIQPQNAQAHNNLGVAYEALGKTDQAIESYKRATELEPDNKYYRFNYRKCRLHVRRNSKNQPDVEDEEADFSG